MKRSISTFCLFLAITTISVECCTQTLQLESRGDCVKVVQRAVGTTADGIFGANTKNAVIAFQRRNGLTADGIVGPRTWNKIYGGGSSQTQGGSCGCSYDRATGPCSGGPTRGAINLKNYLLRNYGSRQEIYNCRTVRGGSSWSLHAEGRAVDHYVSGTAGTEIFNHLISIACQNGIQEVIYNRKIWTSGANVHNYNGVNPHTDHVHVGLNKCGAQNFNL